MSVLFVDRAQDRILNLFATQRERIVKEAPQGSLYAQLRATKVNRDNLLEHCRTSPPNVDAFETIAFCCHGSAGAIHRSSDEVLFSEDDDPGILRQLSENRTLYLLSCKTADSLLPARLLDAGARRFIGFRESPTFKLGTEMSKLWRRVDRRLIEASVGHHRIDEIMVTRDRFIQEAKSRRRDRGASVRLKTDLKNLISVLETMVIEDG